MAIAFPQNPSDGDKYTVGGIVYEYSDGAWRLSSDNSKASIHVATTPPANPQQGDLWFHSGEADLKIYYIDSTSEQWIPASSPPDPYEENFVSISGDTMTGQLIMEKVGIRLNKEDGTRQLTISPNNGDYYTNIYSHNGDDSSDGMKGGLRLRVSPVDGTTGYKTGISLNWNPNTVGNVEYPIETAVNYLRTPTSHHHAANKQYVDDAISQGTNKIPGRAYKYSNSHSDNLPRGCFHVEGNGTVQISRWDKDDIETATAYTNDWKASVKGIISIRDSAGEIKHAQAFDHFYQGQNNAYHIKINKSTEIKDGKSGFVSGTTYYICDGIYNL